MINSKCMGVINITPNSFSDGGRYNQLDTFSKKFNLLKNWADIIDIGAESTAPFNDAIDSYDELCRYESILFPYVYSHKDPHITLSIDTYKPEVFYEVCFFINKYWPKTRIIFNDVSGKVDSELLQIFEDDTIEFDYVLSHNLCPDRHSTGDHMQYCTDSDIIENLISFFSDSLNKLNTKKRKIYLDPCFGFSKTQNQNYEIIKNIHKVVNSFKGFEFLYGISRKSFLRVGGIENSKDLKNINILDQMQSIVIYMNEVKNLPFVYRVHEPYSLKSALNIRQILS